MPDRSTATIGRVELAVGIAAVAVAAIVAGTRIWRAKQEKKEFELSRGRPSVSFVRRVPDSGRAYRFRLTNLGGAPLNRPEVELVDSDGQTISSDGPVLETDNLATDESEEFVLKVSDDHQDVDPLRVRVSWWTVDFDQKEQISNVEVPPG